MEEKQRRVERADCSECSTEAGGRAWPLARLSCSVMSSVAEPVTACVVAVVVVVAKVSFSLTDLLSVA